ANALPRRVLRGALWVCGCRGRRPLAAPVRSVEVALGKQRSPNGVANCFGQSSLLSSQMLGLPGIKEDDDGIRHLASGDAFDRLAIEPQLRCVQGRPRVELVG